MVLSTQRPAFGTRKTRFVAAAILFAVVVWWWLFPRPRVRSWSGQYFSRSGETSRGTTGTFQHSLGQNQQGRQDSQRSERMQSDERTETDNHEDEKGSTGLDGNDVAISSLELASGKEQKTKNSKDKSRMDIPEQTVKNTRERWAELEEMDNPWMHGVPLQDREYHPELMKRVGQMEKQVQGDGSLFCFAVVSNPPEPTFEVFREQIKSCSGWLLFSNFSDPERGIFKAVDRVMNVGIGG